MHQQQFTSRQSKSRRWRFPWLWTGLSCGLIAVCLACGLVATVAGGLAVQSEQVSTAVADLLATSTPTATVPTPTWTPAPTPTPTTTPTVTPIPPGSTPVAVAPAGGWTFEGVRIQPDPGLDGLTIYGEAFNDSGAPQRILGLQSTLYDSQGQVLSKEVIDDYWPLETVPAGGRMPFELTALGPSQADRVELQITTEPGQPPRTDFELTEVEGVQTETEFCVKARVRNLGQPLDSYLMVVAVLYDDDDRVINWGIGYQPAPADLVGDETVAASACAERFFHTVARYELRAWGL